ncbi:MAG TPA: DNA polymerase III subunit delta [Rhizomicrobium sp.]|nr:DNA polymerase III subunit delta [Rhizomicrobium sp.]
MIVKPSDVERYVEQRPKGMLAVLVFGPDRGLVRERADRLARAIVPDLSDPFRVADLDEDALDGDAARLADEAAALSMTGGERVVRIRSATNGHTKIFESFLDANAQGALVVVEAGDLAKTGSLRKLFSEADNAAAIACYPDNVSDLEDVLRRALKADGLSIAHDALDYAASHLGSDRGVTRREIEKLTLYAHGKKSVELADVRAVMGDESEARSDDACDAAGEGDYKKLDQALERLWIAEETPTSVLRAAMSHFQRLALARAQSERGEALDSVLRKMRPPVHFSRLNSYKAQAQRWSEPQLLHALDMLLETEALCKTTAVPAEAACGRALLNIAAMVRR